MTALLLGLALAPIQYSFDPGTKLNYDSKITFEGFIPILGGNEGTVVVEMGVLVDGLKPTKEKTVRAANEITQFKVTFNGAVLPLDVTSVQTYFPRTTISLERTGKIVESDAPNILPPVRLPGLDVKRFPDITYVPLQFPEKELAVGDSWTFTRKFSDSEMSYTCKVGDRKGDAQIIEVSIRQEYEVLENSALEVVKEEKDAERRVKTVLTGNGIVLFDTKRGIIMKSEMVNNAASTAVSLADGKKTERKLKTNFSLSLQEPKVVAAKGNTTWLGSAWAAVSNTATSLWESTVGWWTIAKLAFLKKFASGG